MPMECRASDEHERILHLWQACAPVGPEAWVSCGISYISTQVVKLGQKGGLSTYLVSSSVVCRRGVLDLGSI